MSFWSAEEVGRSSPFIPSAMRLLIGWKGPERKGIGQSGAWYGDGTRTRLSKRGSPICPLLQCQENRIHSTTYVMEDRGSCERFRGVCLLCCLSSMRHLGAARALHTPPSWDYPSTSAACQLHNSVMSLHCRSELCGCSLFFPQINSKLFCLAVFLKGYHMNFSLLFCFTSHLWEKRKLLQKAIVRIVSISQNTIDSDSCKLL